MSGRPAPKAILFDLGGVLLPFDQERRIAALMERFGCEDDAARAFMADGIHWRISLGEADERDLADVFTAAFGRRVDEAEAADLLLTVFETPNHDLWDLAGSLRARALVGGFSDNPRFVERLFPAGAVLDPMFFSSELRVFKPQPEAFAAVEAALGLPRETILFIDDTAANVDAAIARGWDAIRFTTNAALISDLAARGLP
ncbi:MAG TPA: HAD-IA family hydrolase [Caulobacteraceae bacterium]|jgi:HAD superfamily hydrolase (TIGR01509 family)